MESSCFEIFRSLKSFSTTGSSTINLEIVTKGCEEIQKPEGCILLDKEVKWVRISEGFYKNSVYLYEEGTSKVLCRADVNQDWSQAEISYLKHNQRAEAIVAGFLSELIFRNRIIIDQGVVIHASAVSFEGRGILFTAPSETGKSTQAKLWAKHRGAIVLNDDRPALRLVNKKTFVYGTPWSGTKTLFRNESASLNAIIILEQAQENKIRRLPVSTTSSHILSRCFLPYYDQEIMGMCLNTLSEILIEVPVYWLECKPDKEAVDLVYQSLLG